MFVVSVKSSSIKAAVLSVMLVACAVFGVYAAGRSVKASVSSAKSGISYSASDAAERIAFLSQFGWEVKPQTVEECQVTIPAEFDKIFTGYNEIQKRQGLDLSDYKKKKVVRYTYEVTNYKGAEGTVYANVIVYRNRVIGGDICSADVTGFIHGFEK
jgi:hypothetical protein